MPAVLVAGQDAEYTTDSPAGSPRAALVAWAGSAVRWWAYELATCHHRPLPPHPPSPRLPVAVAAFVAVLRVLRAACCCDDVPVLLVWTNAPLADTPSVVVTRLLLCGKYAPGPCCSLMRSPYFHVVYAVYRKKEEQSVAAEVEGGGVLRDAVHAAGYSGRVNSLPQRFL